MPKIGDVFSGGSHIGEVWTDDSLDGCGVVLTGILMVFLFIFWALPWTFTHAPGVILGLIFLPVGLLLLRIGIYYILHAGAEKDPAQETEARISGAIAAAVGLLVTMGSAVLAWGSFMSALDTYPESFLGFIVFGLLGIPFYLPVCFWTLKWWE